MRYVVGGLAFLLVPILISGVLGFMKQPREAENGKVHLHRSVAIFGTVFSAIFLIPAIIAVFADWPLWISGSLLVPASLGASMVIGFINCRISYDEDGFVAKNFLGIKRKFTYGEVTAFKENMHESYIYMGQHRVLVDTIAIGSDEFIKLVRKKYRTLHDGKSLPRILKTKYDLFNGNATDPGGALFAYILGAVILISLVIFAVKFTYFSPCSESNTIRRPVTFISCKVDQEEVVLTSVDKQIYVIRFIDEQFYTGDIEAICNGNTIAIAYSTKVTPDYADDYYSVKAIEHSGRYLLSFEQTNRFHSQEYWPLVLIASGMLLFWGVYVAGSIIVARNPRRFSKKFVLLFFKDGYIRY